MYGRLLDLTTKPNNNIMCSQHIRVTLPYVEL